MNRPARVRIVALGAWLLCGVMPLYVMTRAQNPAGRADAPGSNFNGNMNVARDPNPAPEARPGGRPGAGGMTNLNMSPAAYANMNGALTAARRGETAEDPEVAEASPAASAEWVEVGQPWGYAVRSPLVLRSGAGDGSQVVARVKVEGGEGVSILETAGARLRVRVEANAEQGGTRQRAAEGWVEWGAVEPVAEALVVEIASGEVVRRVPLESGVTSVLFAPGGETALFHGAYAGFVYEAGADDFKPRRGLKLDGAVSVDDVFFQPGTGQLVVPVWRVGNDPAGNYTLDFARAGGPTAGVPSGIAASGEGHFLVSPDGQTGFAVYNGGASWGGEGRLSVAVFDLQTLTQTRGFVLPDSVTSGAQVILGRGGSELLALSEQEPQRLLVVESTGGTLVREVRLTTGGNMASWVTAGAPGARPLIAYADSRDDNTGVTRLARLTPEGKAARYPDGVTLVAEAGGAEYGIDEGATRLFVLDEGGRVRSSRPIKARGAKPPAHRPDAPAAEGEGRVVQGVFATPDGKRLVIIKGVAECGC